MKEKNKNVRQPSQVQEPGWGLPGQDLASCVPGWLAVWEVKTGSDMVWHAKGQGRLILSLSSL